MNIIGETMVMPTVSPAFNWQLIDQQMTPDLQCSRNNVLLVEQPGGVITERQSVIEDCARGQTHQTFDMGER